MILLTFAPTTNARASDGQFGRSSYNYVRAILAFNNDPSCTIYSQNSTAGGAVFEGANTAGSSTSYIYRKWQVMFSWKITAGMLNYQPRTPMMTLLTTRTTYIDGQAQQVYNGPTLNVKDVIQELQHRIADRDAVINYANCAN